MVCQQLKKQRERVTSQPFYTIHKQKTVNACLENWITSSKVLWTSSLVHTHSFKRKQNRAQGIAEKYFCIGMEWRWDWQSRRKYQAIQFVIALNCSTQKPLISGTHGALAEVPATGESFLGELKRRNVVAAFVVQITLQEFWWKL